MKLATIKYQGNILIAVEVDEDSLLPLSGLELSSGGRLSSMLQLAQSSAEVLTELRDYRDQNLSNSGILIAKKEVSWLPPIVNPGKICGVAMNNSASNARKIRAPEHPAFFLKPSSCLIGHQEPIVIRSYYGSVHPEPEFAVVIGKRIRDLTPEQVPEHIFGYTIFNDITGNGMRAEDLFQYYALYPKKDNPDEVEKVEQHLSYAARYKGTDSFGVMGPWLVTRDEVSQPDDLRVQCSIGDEKIADDSTRYYNYKVAEVISFLSYFHTLSPGDVVSMGTAFKPGATRKSIHHANFLVVGGPVSIEIEGLGRQENPVIIQQREIGKWRLTPTE